jgi:nucleoside-diphosphate-sugar epimerase
VRAAVRRQDAVDQLPTGVEPVIVEVHSIEAWSRATRRQDAVVHLIGMTHMPANLRTGDLGGFREVNVAITRQVLAACGRTDVKRFLYVSSVKAIGEATPAGTAFTEATVCAPEDSYGKTKREAELLVTTAAGTGQLQTTILRPPLVYGAGVRGNFLRLMKWIDRRVPLPLASVDNERSMIYVGNLASAVVASLVDRRAGSEIFHVADRQPVSTPALIRAVAELMGQAARLYPMPERLLTLGGRVIGRSADVRRLTGSLLLSTEYIASTIGWRAPYSMEDGLAHTVAWYRNEA